MNLLARALWAEILKLKRTLTLWMVVIAPLVVVGLISLLIYFQAGPKKHYESDEAWRTFISGIVGLWSLLMLPLFVTLESALLAGLEHNEKQWKYLFTLPVPRWTIYLAKLLVCLMMVTVCTFILGIGIMGAGIILGQLLPQFKTFWRDIPWLEIFRGVVLTSVAAWLIVAIHTWVSLRWRSFTVSVGFGMSATIIGFLLSQSDKWGKFYPWSLPANTFTNGGENMLFALLFSIVGCIVAGGLGCWEMTRRDVL